MVKFTQKRNIVLVKNINHGTDEDTDYIGAWEGIKGIALGCSNLDCPNEEDNPALVGGHVKKVYSDDNSWYITPLCHKCNASNNNNPMRVYEDRLAAYNVIKDLR